MKHKMNVQKRLIIYIKEKKYHAISSDNFINELQMDSSDNFISGSNHQLTEQ